MSRHTSDDGPLDDEVGTDIALVGMAGRFPGADGVRRLWHNIRAGKDTITRFTEEELRASGVSEELLADPAYVRAGSVIDGIDLFDAGFFGYTPSEAQLLDPQQRLFLETAWHALEDAGADPARFDGTIGVAAGTGISWYMMNNLNTRPELTELFGDVQVGLGNDKDSLATRTAYTLDLTGPCYTVQSYCSTSLVAVSLACSTLVSGEADLMLAGGVSVLVPHRVGYLYQEAGMASPDGACRAFDAAAQGTPVGSGVGVVALRRLEDALADGDRVYAVIRGWAITNDGADKVGFTAPGVRGQAAVMAEALASAGLEPADIDYVEAHGTGTGLGDAIEISALQHVFDVPGVTRCAIGSVKTNLGHLDRAAGVTGLIKTALALQHEEIPPTLNFDRPNPQLLRSADRLEVVNELRPWPRGERTRRAGVSAFGMGGTNAHVVLEEAEPAGARPRPTPRENQLLLWSARSAEAADELTDRLRQAHAELPEPAADQPATGDVADLAYTLQSGRAVFEHRRAAVVTSRGDALAALGADAEHRVFARRDAARRQVGFLLAGVGEHYQGMVGGLYRTEPAFRSAIDTCAALFQDLLGVNPVAGFLGERESGAPDLAQLLGRTGPAGQADAASATEIVQPAMFAVDYALGRLLMSWGVQPRLLLGYSVGEFAAACLSGALTLPEAAGLTAFRAQLIAGLPAGAMAAVPLSQAELTARFGPLAGTGVDVAAVNGPGFTVVSGPVDAVAELSARLAAADVPSRPLRTTHAFHSAALRPAAAELTAWARTELHPQAPTIPYLSNVTGAPITEAQLADPGYWADHMCGTVRFSDMLTHLFAAGDDILLELGPGQSLGAMARNHPDCPRERWPLLLPTLPAQADPTTDEAVLTTALAQLWLAGGEVDWDAYHEGREPRRVSAPPYPFRRERYWIDPAPAQASAGPADTATTGPAKPTAVASAQPATPIPGKQVEQADPLAARGLFHPRWTPRPLPAAPATALPDAPVWIFADERGVADALAERLAAARVDHLLIRPAGLPAADAAADGSRTVRPAEQQDYQQLIETSPAPRWVVHLWGLDSALSPQDADCARELGFDSLRALTAALGDARLPHPVSLLAATESARAVLDTDRPAPERATAFGPLLVAPQEYAGLQVRTIDTVLTGDVPGDDARSADAPAGGAPGSEGTAGDTPLTVAAALYAELLHGFDHPAAGTESAATTDPAATADRAATTADHLLALRGGARLALEYVPAPAPDDPPAIVPKADGVYLITGGLGPVGLLLAEHFGAAHGARLVLTGRRELPARTDWERAAADPATEPALRERLTGLLRLVGRGVQVEAVAADVTDEARLRALVTDVRERHGRLDGVIHLAAITDAEVLSPLSGLGPQERDAHFHAKIDGALALEKVLAELPVDFCLLFSSMSTVLGGIGFGSYAAANSFLDAVAARHRAGRTRWLAVDWDTWPATAASISGQSFGASLAEYALHEAQALAAVDQVLASPHPRTLVSAGGLPARLAEWVHRRAAAPAGGAGTRFPRPDLAQQFVPPAGALERKLADLWGDLLGVDGIGARDNFSDLGGTSLMVLQLVKQIRREFAVTVSPITLFEAPTVHAMAAVIAELRGDTPQTAPQPAAEPARAPRVRTDDDRIAVVGLAGRFPGAADIAAFWENLSNGVESVSRFTPEELLASGVAPELVHDPNYVPARPVLDDIRTFDAGFFGYSPREASTTDPQHRLFLECAWEALEHGGYGTAAGRGRVGVFAGSNLSTYLMLQAASLADAGEADLYSTVIGNDKDSLATGVSYKLGLTGPSLSVQTFCSTALVATHLACQSLRHGECEMALAGGAGIHVPDRVGHLYVPGGMESPDGRVRTFDAQAGGTLFGDGVGVLLLKRLDQALADGDTVHAVIRGSAINNDGSLKVGYTAPSVVGQATVVADAMAAAGVTGDDIGYIEAHGTATELGDPIEVRALVKAFGPTTRKQYCPIGSVKTNIGHLGAAAGASGLIKTVLALRHRQLPPSLNFDSPNPEIDFGSSPFYVNTALTPWQVEPGRTRIAGVNSLGMGGTNVHVVVEEPPGPQPAAPGGPDRRYELFPLSARTADAADQAVARLGSHLRHHPETPLDVAYTLQAGRERFEHRRVLVAQTPEALHTATEGADAAGSVAGLMRRADATAARPVDFLFAGVGEQYPGLVGELYHREPEFKAAVDACLDLLPETGTDLRRLLTTVRERPADDGDVFAAMLGRGGPADAADEAAAAELARTELAQPAAFVVDYALARLLGSWGITPATMLGYSLGEYVAACLAGVLTLPDALRLVAHRAALIGRLPAGAMLSLPLSAQDLGTRFGNLADLGLDIAVSNGPDLTVIGGPVDAVDAFEARLQAADVPGRRLATTHAFHTRMLEPISAELTAWISEHITLHPPQRPYLSNVTGELATADLVTDPGYWARHMCTTVRFSAGLAHLLAEPDTVLLEIGPGQSLGAMVRVHPDCPRDRWPLVVPTLPAQADPRPDDQVVTETLARLWLVGTDIDWTGYHQGRPVHRVPLPTYPFQRREYWLDPARTQRPAAPAAAVDVQLTDVTLDDVKRAPLPLLPEADWLHALVWRQTAPRGGRLPAGRWLVFTDTGAADEVCAPLTRRLTAAGGTVTLVRPAEGPGAFEVDGDGYRVRPGDAGALRTLMRRLRDGDGLPDRIVHLWTLSLPAPAAPLPSADEVERALVYGADTLVGIATAASDVGAEKWSLDVVTCGTRAVTGAERVRPELSTVSGPVRGIPLEYTDVSCRMIDTDPVRPAGAAALAALIAAELGDGDLEPVVALRNGRRWLPDYETLPDQPAPAGPGGSAGFTGLTSADRPADPAATDRPAGNPIDPGPLRPGGVYLVTGGLGGIGLAMAERLARDTRGKLVLFGRTGLPPRETWQQALDDPAVSDEVRRRLTGVLRLEEHGAEVEIVTGDVSVVADAARAVRVARERFGALHGVLHAAGLPGIGLMQFKTIADMRKVMAPKTGGTLALEQALDGVPLDFLVLFSSITSATGGGPGQVDYSAANSFLDSYAEATATAAATDVGEGGPAGRRTLTIGWGEWQWNAWEAGLAGYDVDVRDFFRANRQRFGIDFDAGWRLLLRALRQDQPYVVANTQDFSLMERLSRNFTVELVGGGRNAGPQEGTRHPRPDLVTPFVPPSGEVQQVIADVWADLLGLAEIGADDSFFDLGGSSLIGMEVMARIRRRLAIDELAPHVLYEAPSVARLATLLAGRGAPAGGPATPTDTADDQDRSDRRKRSLRRAKNREAEGA